MPMTYLSWDESRACVLAWQRFVTHFAGVNRDRVSGAPAPDTAMENNE
jgi:hypothetical protein